MNQGSNTRGSDVLTLGLTATVLMWLVLYIVAFPRAVTPQWMLIAAGIAIAAIIAGAGRQLGRRTGKGLASGVVLGVVITLLNLLVLLGLLGGEAAEHATSASGWIGGLLVASVLICGGAAAIGRRGYTDDCTGSSWNASLARVTLLVTIGMIVAGGVVTGLEAGLAVEGWLIAEGHPLVLFPLELMQRDVPTFVEHAHRLWGLLVGFSTILLMIQLWRTEDRRWVCILATAVVLAVALQGVLGGTRVTEKSVSLGIIHGVFAHVVLATIALVSAVVTTTWREASPTTADGVATDRKIQLALVVIIAAQITAGTAYRHLESVPGTPTGVIRGLLDGHSFVGSVLVLAMAIWVGVRAWGLYRDIAPVRKKGLGLMHLVAVQVILGFSAFVVVPKVARDPAEVIPTVEVVITTAHQVTGALLLSMAVLLTAWTRILVHERAPGLD